MHQRNPMFIKQKQNSAQIPAGVWPVGLTAFTEDGCIDWNANGQLLDWYVSNGVTGIFTVCLSGEMYFLDEDERLGLAEFARARLDSDISVVAAAGFGRTFNERLDSIKRMSDTGVDAVVVPACQIVDEDADERKLQEELQKLCDKVGDIKLGLYECPLPYHRILASETLGLAAESGKVLFVKDTCSEIGAIGSKLDKCRDSRLKFFNANTNTALESFKLGAAGYCGTGANFFPQLYVELWKCFESDSEKAERLQRLLDVLHRHVCYKYPRSAKYFLSLAGVDITDYCRWESPALTREDKDILQKLYNYIKEEISNN
jgi:4-hydroxy-tetrahydrodipicolinate synthase